VTRDAFPPPEPVRLRIAGGDRTFPVHRVYCVGRNYAEHAREMGADPDREPPFFFTKPADAVVPEGHAVPWPPATADLQHEIELVVALGRGGRDVPAEAALELILGYAAGIDLTRRDLQREAKRLARPWDAAKGFEGSAPCSRIQPVGAVGHPARGRIWLAVGDELRQQGDLAAMIWSVPELLARLSTLFRLAPGDLVFTGTPAGVAPLAPGDRVTGGVEGVAEIAVTVG
jgi:fumarylpyruvate hydrolase